jgi:hypothetical protein
VTRNVSTIATLALVLGCSHNSAPVENRVPSAASPSRPHADLIGTQVQFVEHGEEPETASLPAGFSTDDILDFADGIRAIGASGSTYLVILTRNSVVVDVAEVREPVQISATCSRGDSKTVVGVVPKGCPPGKTNAVQAWEVRGGRLEPLRGVVCDCLIDI